MVSGNDDGDLFRRAVGTVRPVRDDRIVPAVSRRAQARRRPEVPPPAPLTPIPDDPVDGAPDAELRHCAPGVDAATLAGLRRGRFPAEARLDLHGATADRAERVLAAFLAEAFRRGYRCVQVVHGKGYRSPDGRPVLKGRVAAWLRGHPQVLAYVSAVPSDGGTGAVYVLLRRGRTAPPRRPPGV